MKNRLRSRAPTLTCLAPAWVLGGCPPLLVESSPDTFPVPDGAASGLRAAGGSVALENACTKPTVVPVSNEGVGVDADFQQYTRTAMTLPEHALAKRGNRRRSDGTENGNLENRQHRLYLRLDGRVQPQPDHRLRQRGSEGGTGLQPFAGDGRRRARRGDLHAVSKLLLDEPFERYMNE